MNSHELPCYGLTQKLRSKVTNPCVLMYTVFHVDRSSPPLSPALRDPAQHRHPRVAAGGQPRGIFSRQSLHQTRLLTCWCLRGLTPSIRLGRLDFCPWQSSIFRQSPTFMLKIRKRLDAHEPHELPCCGLTQKLHGRVTNPAYLCTRSTYAQTAATPPFLQRRATPRDTVIRE